MYQIFVSINGRFLFRTDVFQNRQDAKIALDHIFENFQVQFGYKVALQYQNPSKYHIEGQTSKEIFSKLESNL